MMSFDYVKNSTVTDEQITAILLEEFDRYAESSMYGTGATRGVLIRQHGMLKGQPARLSESPLLLQFVKNTDQLTNSTGKDPRRCDSFPYTAIDDFNGVVPASKLDALSSSRVVTCQSSGPNKNFFVTTQSMSVSGGGAGRFSELVYVTCIERAIQEAWIAHVGDSKMSPNAFKASLYRYIATAISRRVLGLQILDIVTTFDKTGTTWSTEVHYAIAGDRKTINGTVVAHRN